MLSNFVQLISYFPSVFLYIFHFSLMHKTYFNHSFRLSYTQLQEIVTNKKAFHTQAPEPSPVYKGFGVPLQNDSKRARRTPCSFAI